MGEPEDVADRLAAIEDQVADACTHAGRPRKSVTLLLVSKRQPMSRLEAAYRAGHRDFGENYVQELVRRQAELPKDLRWHLIGHLQRNKAKPAAQHAASVHSVDSDRLARALSKASVELRDSPLPVLIEVNIAGEAGKSGIEPAAAETLVNSLQELPGLTLEGLMAPPVRQQASFAALRKLRDTLSERTGHPLPALSMGMSHDFEAAIEEGATVVRVGSAAFGHRDA